MKTNYLFYSFAFLSLLFAGCSKNTDNQIPENTFATLTTSAPQNISGLDVTIGGTVTAPGGSQVYEIGVCWSVNHDPTITNDVKVGTGSPTGSFTANFSVAESNKIYYARAYAKNSAGVAYGNEVNFTSSYAVITRSTANILPKSAILRATTVNSTNYQMMARGFVYSTSPNPNISSNNITTGSGFGDYEMTPGNLQPNTVYYVKAYFTTMLNAVHYGEEVSFKTTGYFGPAAGYVVYDKGEFTDGWRYLEVYQIGIDYITGLANGSKWGCYTSYLSLTTPEVGAGPANTQRIVSSCNDNNSAARLCDNYVRNGFSDWFLPSKDELLLISKSLQSFGIDIEGGWTSTELNTGYAYIVTKPFGETQYIVSNDYKDSYRWVYPVRRY